MKFMVLERLKNYGARKIEKIIMNKIEDHLFQHLDSKIEVN